MVAVALTDFVFVTGAWGEAAAVTARHSATAITVAAARMRSSLHVSAPDSARTCHFRLQEGVSKRERKTTTCRMGEARPSAAVIRFWFLLSCRCVVVFTPGAWGDTDSSEAPPQTGIV